LWVRGWPECGERNRRSYGPPGPHRAILGGQLRTRRLRDVPEQVTLTTVPTGADDRAPRRRGRPGNDLEAGLQAAVEVFNERGYDGASMEDLSKRLGIAKSGIYHHVSGKEELLRMALDRALDGLWEAADRARGLDAPAIVRLETLVRDAIAVLVS